LHFSDGDVLLVLSCTPWPTEERNMQDVIKREIIINAAKERIYAAIADPEKVVLWFPKTIEGDYKVGERPIFGFGEHGRNQVYIVAAKPFEYFAYRWVPGANHFLGDVLTVPHTLVEFHIEELSNDSCKVILTESGFATLPNELMQAAFEQNSGGWDFMFDRLNNFFLQ
jgi:uncharacterized protein YndB with AHSA1/START domain